MSATLQLSNKDLQRYERIKEQRFNEATKWFLEVAKLGTGKSFGEIALLEDTKRNATITCVTDCDFAVIKRNDYQKVLQRLEVRMQTRKLEFFRGLPFFQHYTRTFLMKFFRIFSQKSFARN